MPIRQSPVFRRYTYPLLFMLLILGNTAYYITRFHLLSTTDETRIPQGKKVSLSSTTVTAAIKSSQITVPIRPDLLPAESRNRYLRSRHHDRTSPDAEKMPHPERPGRPLLISVADRVSPDLSVMGGNGEYPLFQPSAYFR